LVVLVPTFVFLEASLAVLGLGDPTLPTWGKVINEARTNGALYQGLYYWMLQPAVLLMLTGLAFALVGFSLDRIFNPRLRGL
jgi:peptide/nickel transport system permease protein